MEDIRSGANRAWNRVPNEVRAQIIDLALDLIISPAFIAMKASSKFRDKITVINQLWQTDFTYLKVIGWGWFYLSTILDGYSRYTISWKLCTTMSTSPENLRCDRYIGNGASGFWL